MTIVVIWHILKGKATTEDKMENPKILIKIHVNDPAFSQERIEEVKEMAVEFVESLGICA
jgi:hypothetical protein